MEDVGVGRVVPVARDVVPDHGWLLSEREGALEGLIECECRCGRGSVVISCCGTGVL